MNVSNLFSFLTTKPTLLVMAMLAVLLSGCATTNGEDKLAQQPGGKTAGKLGAAAASEIFYDLESQWSAGLKVDDYSLAGLQVAVRYDKACAASDAELACYNAENGQLVWEKELSGLSAGPVISRKLVVVGDNKGSLFAFDRLNGETKWVVDLGAELVSAPAVGVSANREVIVARTAAGRLVALDVDQGKELWAVEQKVPRLTQRGMAAPIVVGDITLAGFDNGRLAAVELATGKPRWLGVVAEPEGRNDLDRLVDVDGRATVSKTSVYASSVAGKTKAFDGRSGKELWTAEVGGYQDLATSRNNVFVVENGRALVALDTKSGRTIWRWELPEDEEDLLLGAPTVYELFVLLGDNEGNLYGISRVAGEQRFTDSVGGDIRQAPVVVDGVIYVYSDEGSVEAFKLRKDTE